MVRGLLLLCTALCLRPANGKSEYWPGGGEGGERWPVRALVWEGGGAGQAAPSCRGRGDGEPKPGGVSFLEPGPPKRAWTPGLSPSAGGVRGTREGRSRFPLLADRLLCIPGLAKLCGGLLPTTPGERFLAQPAPGGEEGRVWPRRPLEQSGGGPPGDPPRPPAQGNRLGFPRFPGAAWRRPASQPLRKQAERAGTWSTAPGGGGGGRLLETLAAGSQTGPGFREPPRLAFFFKGGVSCVE